MILSFHPVFEGDKNIICAGREPDENDLKAIRAADAVVLSQGCGQALHLMVRENCQHVFPNYDTRFGYPGKIGQTRLFEKTDTRHPMTETYSGIHDFHKTSLSYPFVFKFDWGGEGKNVFLICSDEEFGAILERAVSFEKTGQSGFLLQEHIPNQNRDLRVVVVGGHIRAYWRVRQDSGNFRSNLSQGAVTDTATDPELREKGIRLVKDFCMKTKISLAGLDLLFSPDSDTLFFLEINYFFGRRGLGGSEKFYELLNTEIRKWVLTLHS